MKNVSVWAKLFGQPVDVPSGTVIRSNTDDVFDAEYTHDPNIGKWWFSKRLNAHIFPESYDVGKKLYKCEVVYRDTSGNVKRNSFDLPRDDWEPSQKPVFSDPTESKIDWGKRLVALRKRRGEISESRAESIVTRLLN